MINQVDNNDITNLYVEKIKMQQILADVPHKLTLISSRIIIDPMEIDFTHGVSLAFACRRRSASFSKSSAVTHYSENYLSVAIFQDSHQDIIGADHNRQSLTRCAANKGEMLAPLLTTKLYT